MMHGLQRPDIKAFKARALYNKPIRQYEANLIRSSFCWFLYTNDLHETLLKRTKLPVGSVRIPISNQRTDVQRLKILLTCLL